MKKIGLFAIFFVLISIIGFGFVNVKADEPSIVMQEGASIRTTGTQGLKFSATFDETLLGEGIEIGFYVCYGETNVAELQSFIIAEEAIIINGKAPKIVNSYDTTSLTISVVLTGIPVSGYNQSLTVIGYAKVDETYIFVPTAVTRNVINVALKASNNDGAAVVESVLSAIQSNYFRASFDSSGDYSISNSLFETEYYKLKTEFISDWNSFIGTSWAALDATEFLTLLK